MRAWTKIFLIRFARMPYAEFSDSSRATTQCMPGKVNKCAAASCMALVSSQSPQLRRLSVYWDTNYIDSVWSTIENVYKNQEESLPGCFNF